MVQADHFSGRVNSVIYEDASKAFYILKMVLDSEEEMGGLIDFSKGQGQVTIRGNVPGVNVAIGTWFGFEGKWTNHKEHGRQIAISRAPVLKDGWNAETAAKMLTSNGVGERVCWQLREHFKDEFLDVLSKPDRLQEAPGIDQFAALHVSARWDATQAYFRTLGFLNELGLPPGKVREVWTTFGDDAEKVLAQNPWALSKVDGITFQQADSISRRMGLSPDAPERVHAAVLFACKTQRTFGHLFLSTGQLYQEVRRYLGGVEKRPVAEAMAACHRDKSIVIDNKTRDGFKAVYEPWALHIESESALLTWGRTSSAGFGKGGLAATPFLHRLASVGPQTAKEVAKGDLRGSAVAAVEEWGQFAKLQLSEAQKEGVVNALAEPISCLTGLPGTGKTTSLKAAVKILQTAQVPFLLCAPTGIAAKRQNTLTGAPAYTIHRAFMAKGKSEDTRKATYAGIVGDRNASIGEGKDDFWGYGPGNHHPAEVVIVDESSMVDQHLLYRIMTCTSPQCRVVFVGDAAQLPSVGPGNVLRDCIASKMFPTVNLTEIFRQKDTSGIVYAAHDIHKGDVPDTTSKDFTLIQRNGEEDTLAAIKKIAEKLYVKRREFQVISPRHGGTVGVTALNSHLRTLLNPAGPGLLEIKLGSDVMREGDRIMVVKNDYNRNVFNGDVGKINRVDKKARSVELKIFGSPPLILSIPFRELSKLIRMAYACTVHKAQGLEYDVIVMPLVDSFRHQLQRNLLYTAITRARKQVILVGSHSALETAIRNDKEDQRNTLFLDRLLNLKKSEV